MRALLIATLLLSPLACKRSKPAAEQPPNDPYKNVVTAPAKVKADVEQINQQHEDKLDKTIEGAKSAQ